LPSISWIFNKVLNRVETKLKRTRLISNPPELTIEPTLQCNSDCIMCNRSFNREEDKISQGFLSWDILNKTSPYWPTAHILFGGFGESFMHPQYLEMLRAMKHAGASVYTYSNGILLTEALSMGLVDAKMNKINISMGGATGETYRKIRGVDAFQTVVRNLKSLRDYKRERATPFPRVSFNVVAMESVMPEIKDILELAKELGVEEMAMPNLVVQGDALLDEFIWSNMEKNQKIIAEAVTLAKKLQITFHPPVLDEREGYCWDLFTRLNVNWDGSVMSCAMERFILGDLRSQSITEIWNSPALSKLRGDFLAGRAAQHCPQCSCRNLTRESLVNPWFNARSKADRLWDEKGSAE
jgi:MoaA/NifB/PqqE/SkfB family radical SAM enzyme